MILIKLLNLILLIIKPPNLILLQLLVTKLLISTPLSIELMNRPKKIRKMNEIKEDRGVNVTCQILQCPKFRFLLEYLIVLQKFPSEANPKVRNHGEGPY